MYIHIHIYTYMYMYMYIRIFMYSKLQHCYVSCHLKMLTRQPTTTCPRGNTLKDIATRCNALYTVCPARRRSPCTVANARCNAALQQQHTTCTATTTHYI